jgi:hypothetical protein
VQLNWACGGDRATVAQLRPEGAPIPVEAIAVMLRWVLLAPHLVISLSPPSCVACHSIYGQKKVRLHVVDYFSQNAVHAIGALLIGFFVYFVIYILSLVAEGLFLYHIPKWNGWFKAYIDDYGKVSYEDEKSGKVVALKGGMKGEKQSIEMITQKQADALWDSFFGEKK